MRQKSISLHCMICNHMASNLVESEIHLTSELHVENAKKYKPIAANPQPPPQNSTAESQASTTATKSIPPQMKPMELSKLQNDLNQKALLEIVSKNKKDWKCVNCK